MNTTKKEFFPNILQGTEVEGGLIGKDRRGSEHLKKLTQVYKITPYAKRRRCNGRTKKTVKRN